MHHPRHPALAGATHRLLSVRRISCRPLIAFAISVGCAFVCLARGSDSASFCGQQTSPVQSGLPIRSEVELQTVNVQVKDKKGDDVKGLTASDFTLREDGKAQKIAFFDAGNGPVDVAVLVDSSGSMVGKWHLGSAQEIAARFMRIARPGDQIRAMDFTEWTGPFEQLTAAQLSNPGLATLSPAGGSGSSIHDAIAAAVCHLRDSKNARQAIIVITDGVDEHSRISLDQLIDVVRSQRAQLFLIGLPSRPEFDFQKHAEARVTLVSGNDINNPAVLFERLAKEAGAETFIPQSETALEDALKAVSNLLDSEYTLAYYPAATSRRLRKIDVKVGRSGARVLSSRFVVADPDSADIVHFLEGTCTVSPEQHPYPYESHVTNSEGGMIYRDDFSDPHSGWPQHPDSRYVTGGYELSTVEEPTSADDAPPETTRDSGMRIGRTTNLVANYRENVVAAYGPSWRDFRVSATMRGEIRPVTKEGPQRRFTKAVRASAGLVFRMNQEGYYALLVSGVQKEKELSFELVARKFEGDSYAEAVIVPWTTIARESPSKTKLAVEDIGDQITVFVDGQEVGSARDDTFSEGYVGFTVSAPARATFGNLLVEQASASHRASSAALAPVERTPSDSGQAGASATTAAVESNLVVVPNRPWMSKPYDAWNDRDIQSILTQSPWVQTTTIQRTWLPVAEKDVPPERLISGGIRSWPKDAPNLSGASPAVTIRESEASQSELNVYVYWVSSRVMRAASARQSVLHGEINESDVEPYVRAALDEYALGLSMADMTPFLQNDEKFFQRQAFLEMWSRGRELSPSHVVYRRDAKGNLKQVLFFFPKKTPSGEPTITPDETDVEFKCRIGDSTLHVGFSPQKMTDQAGPDL
jgi:Ca-activated chloride channel homolog